MLLAAFPALAQGPLPIQNPSQSLGLPPGFVPGGDAGQKARLTEALTKGLAAQAAFSQLSPEEEHTLGRSVSALVLAKYKLLNDQKLTEYVNTLGHALAWASDRPELFGGWRFLVLDTDEVNALSAPGGFVFVSKGLLRCCPSEDALAAVLAHEIAHIVHKHGLKAIQKSRLASVVTRLAFDELKSRAPMDVTVMLEAFEGSILDIFKTLVENGYSREYEVEADVMAVKLVQKLGYDPSGLVDMLMVMEDRMDPNKMVGFYKTHPSPLERFSAVKVEAPFAYAEVKPLPERQERMVRAFSGIAPDLKR